MLITHENFYSSELNRTRTLRVLLPRNYKKHHDRRFPVIYLHDGQNLFDAHTAAFRHWRLREAMTRQPLYRQAILVGIDNATTERVNEYAPFQRTLRYARSSGEGDAYLNFIINTVKPFIDNEYRTWAHREATGIVGSSMGGLISFYAGLRYAGVFGKVGALSPSFWFNPQVMTLAQEFRSITKSKFYIAASRTESRAMASQMERVYWSMIRGGFSDSDIRVVLRDRGRHSETFWAKEFSTMFEYLFAVTAM
jgi:predicted alpha/beta superfamily hydrolase